MTLSTLQRTPFIPDGEKIDLGETCYTVGLFRYIYGHEKNLPLVYTGNIALYSESTVPSWDAIRREVRPLHGCLIQTPGIHGASGSPVFVRRPLHLAKQALVYDKRVRLFGIFVSAWFLPPEGEARKEFGATEGDVLPVGLGIVVHASRIIEILEQPQVKDERNKANAGRERREQPQDTAVIYEQPGEVAGDEVLRRMLNTKPKRDG